MLMSPADVARIAVHRQQRRIGRWRAAALPHDVPAFGLGGLIAAWRFAPDRLPHPLQPIAVLGLGEWAVRTDPGRARDAIRGIVQRPAGQESQPKEPIKKRTVRCALSVGGWRSSGGGGSKISGGFLVLVGCLKLVVSSWVSLTLGVSERNSFRSMPSSAPRP
jgi:hypothetical protein